MPSSKDARGAGRGYFARGTIGRGNDRDGIHPTLESSVRVLIATIQSVGREAKRPRKRDGRRTQRSFITTGTTCAPIDQAPPCRPTGCPRKPERNHAA